MRAPPLFWTQRLEARALAIFWLAPTLAKPRVVLLDWHCWQMVLSPWDPGFPSVPVWAVLTSPLAL